MGLLSDIVSVAAPIVGQVFGGPAGAAIGSAIGSAFAPSGASAARQSSAAQQQAAQQAQQGINTAGLSAIGRLDPFAGIGAQGASQANFLGDPTAQFQFLQNNPLFQLGLNNANRITEQGVASRGRLSSGDTLMQLNNNALLAAQPLLNAQRGDILSQLNIGQNAALQQGGIEQNSALNQANLITGAGAANAAGIVGANNANQQRFGNLLGAGIQLAGNQGVQDFFGGLFNSSPPPTGGFSAGNLNLSQTPLGINTGVGSFGFGG
jgi:hypothetical protein